MKNKIAIIGVSDNGAVSKIVRALIKCYTFKNEKSHFFTFGYANSNNCLSHDNVDEYLFKNPFKYTFFYRLTNKIFNKIGFDTYLLSWRFLYKKINKIFEKIKPDIIICTSGQFFYMKVGYKLSKKYSTPVDFMFFDPFIANPKIKNKDKAQRELNKWCLLAHSILYDYDGVIGNQFTGFENKLHGFYIPIFESSQQIKRNYSIVYGGSFYGSFRSKELITSFLSSASKRDSRVKFDIYTDSSFPVFDDYRISIHKMISPDEYENIISKCLAVIVVGNGDYFGSIPSKILEAISFKKPIIALNFVEKPYYVKKYPYFFIENENNCIEKIINISESELLNFDIYSSFPERNPNILVELFEKILK